MNRSTLFVGPLDRVLHLRAFAPLEYCTAHQLSVLTRYAEEVTWAPGATIFRRGEPVDACYVIVDGRVTVRTGVTRQAGPRETVGFLEQIARSSEGLEALAVTETLALELDWDSHLEMCEQHFWVLWKYIGHFAHELLKRHARVPGKVPLVPVDPAQQLNFAERMLALGTAGVFPSSSMDAIAELARHVSETTAAPGEQLWTRDGIADEFWLVGSGVVKVVHELDTAEDLVTAGQAAGMLEALAGIRRGTDGTAVERVRALRIGVEQFTDILEDHLEMAVDFMSSLARLLLQRERALERPELA